MQKRERERRGFNRYNVLLTICIAHSMVSVLVGLVMVAAVYIICVLFVLIIKAGKMLFSFHDFDFYSSLLRLVK